MGILKSFQPVEITTCDWKTDARTPAEYVWPWRGGIDATPNRSSGTIAGFRACKGLMFSPPWCFGNCIYGVQKMLPSMCKRSRINMYCAETTLSCTISADQLALAHGRNRVCMRRLCKTTLTWRPNFQPISSSYFLRGVDSSCYAVIARTFVRIFTASSGK